MSWFRLALLCLGIEAAPLFPSSRLCNKCGERGDPDWERNWTCLACGSRHDRDDNAAISLARYSEGDMGTVGVLDRSGAERKIRPGGLLAMKRRRRDRVSQERHHLSAPTPGAVPEKSV